ncbi:MAG: acyl-CoA dehydrogenase family protein [Flavobacteriales bacterium]|nr:acyl-CoA dehydrogenase family protein [Flavobacteriales bacterium]MCB9197787.1 acyl-CoA dehydrogenase family protein [Flavobacteriales bacterium]
MANLFFTEEHELFRASIQDFIKQEVLPYTNDWEAKGQIDRSVMKKMGEMGFLGLDTPEAYGGMGTDFMYTCVLLEEIGKSGALGFATMVASHVYLAMNYLNKGGSEALKQKYLVPSASGDLIGALAMTEPFAGSDLKNIRTTAVKDGDHYIINGSKTFITNAHYGDYIVAAVKTESGISLIVIDNDMPGVTTSKLDKMGLRSSDTAEISFDNVKVPVENLLGKEGMGFYYMMESLQTERLTVSQISVGAMQCAYDLALQYISEREAFGKTIDKLQVIRHKIADIATEIEAWKQFVYITSARFAQGDFVVKECSMLKLKTSDLLNDVVYDCLQLFGGYGFMEEYPIARLYRDVRVIPIFAGTSEIMKEIIAKIEIEKVEYKPTYK